MISNASVQSQNTGTLVSMLQWLSHGCKRYDGSRKAVGEILCRITIVRPRQWGVVPWNTTMS